MAESYIIPVEFFPMRPQKMLRLPERFTVPVGSELIWIVIAEKGIEFHQLPRYRFELYFDNFKSPFDWISQRENFPENSFPEGNPVILARGIAIDPGEYKYGVKINVNSQNEPIYDDDPYLIVERHAY